LSDTRRAKAELEDFYTGLQSHLRVRSQSDYAGLVTANGNSAEPVHRWFRLKEAFSSQLLTRVLKDTELANANGLRILDPFCGVGTTGVSVVDAVAAGDLSEPVTYGIECNPFLHLVANTKLQALRRPPEHFLDMARTAAAAAMVGTDHTPPPDLSTFTAEGHFEPRELQRLLSLRAAIDAEEALGGDPLVIALMRVCLGSIVEPVSHLRRDGRALRLVPNKAPVRAVDAFLRRAEIIAADLPARRLTFSGRALLGDGVRMTPVDSRFRPFDLVLFSPPYPNNIDYTEVYKLENWLLGLIANSTSFKTQRHATVYSHPSVKRPDPLPSLDLSDRENAALGALVRPVEQAVPEDDRYHDARIRMIRGYVRDMYLTLRSARDRMASDGHLVYVVGNSLHGTGPGRFIIAADLLIAACADIAGFEVERIEIARYLRRRSVESVFLRESVVFVRKAF
jgi:hypothetical protein